MQLAERLAGNEDFAPLMSFAGRTKELRLPSIPHRVGGFGGPTGLADLLRAEKFAAVVDATHPFASRMSANAAMACGQVHLPLMVLTRPAWKRVACDDWIEVDNMHAAAVALGDVPRSVFLAVGRTELAAFRGDVAHRYTVRMVDAVEPSLLPGDAKVILARGPFDLDSELQLLRDAAVDIVVSKNSGGAATYAKIAAARTLGLPVVMVKRPRGSVEGELHEAGAVMSWLEALRATHDAAS